VVAAVEEEAPAIDLTQIHCVTPSGALQRDFVFDRRPRTAWIGGRGCSKTVSGSCKVIDYVQNWEGCWGIILAPTFAQMGRGTRVSFETWFPPEWVLKKNMSQEKMYWDILPPGHTVPGRIYFSNAHNPDTFRSAEVAWVWMDEAADCKESVYKVIIACLRQRVPPALQNNLGRAHYPYQLWVTGTPRGHNWIYKRFVEKADRKRVGFYTARSMDNPFLPESYKELAEEYAPGTPWYQQEIEGKFVAFEGLVYPMFDPEVHVRSLPANVKLQHVKGAVDFGTSDPTVIHLMGRDDSGRRWIFKEFYRRHTFLPELVSTLTAWQNEYDVVRFFGDPHAKTEIDTLSRLGVRIVPGYGGLIETGVRAISSLLEVKAGGPGLYVTPDCPAAIAEALSYCHDRGGDAETFTGSIKKKQADHSMDTWRYLVLGDMGRVPGHGYTAMIFR
jgi:hypothetical protein